MDLMVFENDKPYVISEFHEGRFDYMELASDVAETKFFQFLFGQGLVDQHSDASRAPPSKLSFRRTPEDRFVDSFIRWGYFR